MRQNEDVFHVFQCAVFFYLLPAPRLLEFELTRNVTFKLPLMALRKIRNFVQIFLAAICNPLIEMPISWTLDDYPYFEFIRTDSVTLPGLSTARDVLKNWLDDFTYMCRTEDWGILTYTFHPFVIGRGHRMMILEELISSLTDQGAIFTTMADAAEEFIERAPLQTF